MVLLSLILIEWITRGIGMKWHKDSEGIGYIIIIGGILLLISVISSFIENNEEVNDYESREGELERSLNDDAEDQYQDAIYQRNLCVLYGFICVGIIVGGIWVVFDQRRQSDNVPPGQPPPVVYTPPIPPGMMVCPFCRAVIRMGFTSCPNCRRQF